VAAPALGLVSALAVLVAWLANPYLALLLVPAAHVWLLEVRGRMLVRPLALGAIALSLLPLAAAVASIVDRLDLGRGAPWQFVLMVGDGQLGFAPVVALCVLIGCMVGLAAVAVRPQSALPMQPPTAAGWPATPVEPPRRPVASATGQELDASRIRPAGQTDDLAGDG
jgi:hypothetical protein